MFRFLFSVVLLVSIAAPALAQQALPFTKRPVTQEELAVAVEKDDRTILNISAEKMVEAANLAFGLTLESPAELATWIRGLVETPCPAGRRSSLARVLKDEIDLLGFVRAFREGERCLLNTNLARYVLSLLCGNFVTQSDLPIFGAVKAPTALDPNIGARLFGPPVQAEPQDWLVGGTVGPTPEEERELHHSLTTKKSWWTRNKKWFLPVAGVAAGGAVCAIAGCFQMKQTVTVTIR